MSTSMVETLKALLDASKEARMIAFQEVLSLLESSSLPMSEKIEIIRQAGSGAILEIPDESEDKKKAFTSLSEEDLDELVHEAKSQEASEINNEGREAQIAFLILKGINP